MDRLSGNVYRVAMLSESYLTVIGILTQFNSDTSTFMKKGNCPIHTNKPTIIIEKLCF